MLKTLTIATLALAIAAGPAAALTITNKTAKEHTIGVDMGDKEKVEKIAAGKALDLKDQCKDGCGLTGPWGYSWMAKTGESFAFDDKGLIPSGS